MRANGPVGETEATGPVRETEAMGRPGRPGGRPAFVGSAALVAIALVVAVVGDGLVRWLALAGALTLAPDLLTAVRARLERVRPWLPHLVLVGVAGALLFELVLGRPPASRDHGIHYFQAHILVEDMLPRVSGWSDRINHGYPFGEGYPTLGYLWVSALHLVSGGIVGLRPSYAWGLLGVWALILWGVWHVGALVHDDIAARRDGVVDPIDRRWAGCVAAIAWLLDPGDSRQGGWEYLMFHGVWPQALSAGLWVAGLVLTRRALVQPSGRSIALAAIAYAGGMLAHPFGLLTTACSGFGWLVVLATTTDGRSLPIGRGRVIAIVHALAVALAAGGLATFLAASEEMGRSPAGWGPVGELAGRFVIGNLFIGPWAWTGVLAVLGLGLALWAARSFAWLVGGLVLGMLLLGSYESITVLRLDLVAAAFKNLQLSRWAIAIKPLAFALAGPATIVCIRALGQWRAAGSAPEDGGWARRIFVGLLLAPLLAGVLGRVDVLAPRPIGSVDTLENGGLVDAERSLRDALIAERERTGQLRVAFLRKRMGGGLYPLFAIADAGGSVVLDGHVPTMNFVHTVEDRSPPVLKRLGVTHVIHDRPIDEEEALVAALEPVDTFGPYTLARFLPEPASFAELLGGSGSVEVVERSPTDFLFHVESDGPTRLALAWAPSHRWEWTVDGEPREAVAASVRGSVDLLAVELDGTAEVELRYVRHRLERIATWASWMAVLFTLTGLALPRPWTFAERLHSPAALRVSRGLTLVSVAVVLALVVRRQNTQLARTWDEYAESITSDPNEAFPPFANDLVIEREIQVTRTPAHICEGLLGKDPRVGCQESDGGPLVSMAYIDPYLYRCMQFSIAGGGEAEVVLPDGELLVGLVRRGDHRGRHLHYTIDAKGHSQRPHSLMATADLRIRPSGDGAPARIVLSNDSDDTERVCVAAARFGP